MKKGERMSFNVNFKIMDGIISVFLGINCLILKNPPECIIFLMVVSLHIKLSVLVF